MQDADESCTLKHDAREKSVNTGANFVKNADETKIIGSRDTKTESCDKMTPIWDGDPTASPSHSLQPETEAAGPAGSERCSKIPLQEYGQG
jgi:hypothetical protein